MSESGGGVTRITASCMCGASVFSFSVPTSSLPLETDLCHCNISRRISGALCTSYVFIPKGDDTTTTPSKPDLSTLTPYESSSTLTRYFCTTCGTHMYLEYKDDGRYAVATGILDKSDGVVKISSNMWIGDTKDGGASNFITSVGGRLLERWAQNPDQGRPLPINWADDSSQELSHPPESSDRLHAHCHCGGVQFWISRPGEQSKNAESHFPDLLVPYTVSSPANPKNDPWWLPRKDRFLAGTCACNTCRRASGFHVTWWAFIPAVDISIDKDGKEPFRRYFGSLKTYRSSPDVTRAFCSKCGASVFWDGDKRPTLIDVAVGLLDSSVGSRAENWLYWCTGRVSFTEDAISRELITGLEEGLKTYSQNSHI